MATMSTPSKKRSKSTTTTKNNNSKNAISSIEETYKKVLSTVVPSINDHVSSKNKKQFDSNKDGLDFLTVKNSLLLSYMIDLTKLLQYQSSSSSSSTNDEERNACLQRLNEMKVLIEKVKPLEKKMRYQIDRLLTISSSSSSFALVAEEEKTPVDGDDNNDDNIEGGEKGGQEKDMVQMEESDPLAFRPSLDGFGHDDDDHDHKFDNNDGLEDDDDGSDDEEILAAKASLRAGRNYKRNSKTSNIYDGNEGDENFENNDGIYRAPRLSAVPFAEKEEQKMKQDRILKKQRQRMKQSELLSTLKATYGDMPEEEDIGGGASLGKQREAARRLVEQEAEKTKFEEDAFVRLTASRKEKKTRNRIMREEVSNLHSIADIGNVTAGISMAFGKDGGGMGHYSDDEVIKVTRGGGGDKSSRYDNGKRRRTDEYEEGGGNGRKSKHKKDPKNSFQRTLFGMDGSGGKKKKKSRK
jgi:hypothetical protein